MYERDTMFNLRSGLALAFCVVAASSASAQQHTDVGPKGYVAVNGGGQLGNHEFQASRDFELYSEGGTIAGPSKVGNGPLFDIGGGYRVWSKMSVGGSFSYFNKKASFNGTAQVPSPIVVGRHRAAAVDTSLTHNEAVVHLVASWFIPITVKMDAAVFAGPSIFSVSQGFVTGVEIGAETLPFTSIDIIGTTVTKEKKTAVGYNLGAELNYLLRPHIAAGAFMRFSSASVDLPGTDSPNFGGLQIGAGVRYRF
jgi:hypothetical protein